MIRRKFRITECDNPGLIEEKTRQYTYALHLLYKMIDESSDPAFIERFMERFGMTDIEYRSLCSAVKARRTADSAAAEEKLRRADELEKAIADEENPGKRFRMFRKMRYLRRSAGSGPVFGGKALLRDISQEYNKGCDMDAGRLSKKLAEYRKKRRLPLFVVGEANKKGNRFFDLSHIEEGIVVYKPARDLKSTISFKLPDKYKEEMASLSMSAEMRSIPVSLSLSGEFVWFSFDEERLHGFGVDETARRKETAEIRKRTLPGEERTALIKAVYRKYYDEQRERRMVGKMDGRCIAVDLNPTNIGYAVLDRAGEGECRAVECGMFDLSRLCVKTGLSSSDPRQKYLNNKRKYEISIIVKSLFRIASHYKCSEFVMEDLDGVSETSSGTETNRKVRNIWNRLFIEGLILRRCNETGIILTKVNPVYSSFIGNIKHGYADSTNAAVEIGRRGLWKYNKGTFYPNVTLEDIRTVEARFGKDAGYDTPCDWVAMYKALRNAFPDGKEFSHRLRPALGDLPTDRYRTLSMNSYKSEVNHTIFNINFNKIY